MLLVKLILAHLLGDFIFQSNRWVEKKEKNKIAAWQLYAHLLIHGFCIMILVWDLEFIVPCTIIIISHGVIDIIKIYSQGPQSRRQWFLMDQSLHLSVIIAVWLYVENPEIDPGSFNTLNHFLLLTGIVFLTGPSSVIIRTLISRWTPGGKPDNNNPAGNAGNFTDSKGDDQNNSLPEAGKYIGIIERLFTLMFVLTNHWEAVGFLLTAKSVFRFGDLKDAHDRKLTEYVLIGTLLSFGIASLTGLLLKTAVDFGS